jgi:gas vesicle protein
MAEESKGHGFVLLLAGLGIGAAVGILCAPKSGRETREDIAQDAREGKDYLRTRTKLVTEHVGTLVDKGKEQVGKYVDRGSTLVSDQSNRVAAAVDAGREAYWTAEPNRE